jgi:hypothetical protein
VFFCYEISSIFLIPSYKCTVLKLAVNVCLVDTRHDVFDAEQHSEDFPELRHAFAKTSRYIQSDACNNFDLLKEHPRLPNYHLSELPLALCSWRPGNYSQYAEDNRSQSTLVDPAFQER